MYCEGYLCKIQRNDTFGDEITLRVISEIFKVEFDIIPTLGLAARKIITPNNCVAIARVHLDHFGENEETH